MTCSFNHSSFSLELCLVGKKKIQGYKWIILGIKLVISCWQNIIYHMDYTNFYLWFLPDFPFYLLLSRLSQLIIGKWHSSNEVTCNRVHRGNRTDWRANGLIAWRVALHGPDRAMDTVRIRPQLCTGAGQKGTSVFHICILPFAHMDVCMTDVKKKKNFVSSKILVCS